MGAPEEFEFILNSEFYDKSVDPQLIMSMINLMDRQIISDQDIFDRLKAAGIIDGERTLDDVREEMGDLPPV